MGPSAHGGIQHALDDGTVGFAQCGGGQHALFGQQPGFDRLLAQQFGPGQFAQGGFARRRQAGFVQAMPLMVHTGVSGAGACPAHWQCPLPQPAVSVVVCMVRFLGCVVRAFSGGHVG